MNGTADEHECAACGRVGRCYRILRLCARADVFPERAVPESGADGYIDGYLPLCADCLRVCPTCACPVIADRVADLVAWLDMTLDTQTGADGFSLRWLIDPCDDPTHDRPPRREEPPERRPPPDPSRPTPPVAIPGSSWVADEWRDFKIGDLVKVTETGKVGRILYIASHRRGGGVAFTVDFPDGTWIARRPSAVRKVDDPGDDAAEPSSSNER
jgi:hypothetical protein